MTENERVRVIRKHFALTMEEFGNRLGVTKTAISNIESGNRGVTTQMRAAIIREFGINEAWLRTGEGDMIIQMSYTEELADFLGQILADKPEAYRRRLAVAMSKLDDKQLANLADIAEALVAAMSNE